jgi:hypothetical protein
MDFSRDAIAVLSETRSWSGFYCVWPNIGKNNLGL